MNELALIAMTLTALMWLSFLMGAFVDDRQESRKRQHRWPKWMRILK